MYAYWCSPKLIANFLIIDLQLFIFLQELKINWIVLWLRC